MRNEHKKQGREEDADSYRERVAAIEEILSEHDREQEERRAAGQTKNASDDGLDWRNPSDAMRKVWWACFSWFAVQYVILVLMM